MPGFPLHATVYRETRQYGVGHGDIGGLSVSVYSRAKIIIHSASITSLVPAVSWPMCRGQCPAGVTPLSRSCARAAQRTRVSEFKRAAWSHQPTCAPVSISRWCLRGCSTVAYGNDFQEPLIECSARVAPEKTERPYCCQHPF